MTNDLSVRARLSASLADPAALRAVSCVGYRSRAQLRDKHNLFGVSVGGRVDVYARLFDAPGVVSFVTDGTLVSHAGDVGLFRIPLPDYPGFYAVRYVGPAEDPGRQGSLQHWLVRGAVQGASTDHDFVVTPDPETTGEYGTGSVCETAWSAYQDGVIYAYDSWSSGDGVSRSFKVDLYWTDGIKELQGLVDSPEVRNVAADYVIRFLSFIGISIPSFWVGMILIYWL